MIRLQGLIRSRHRHEGSVPGELKVGCIVTNGRLLMVAATATLEASSTLEAAATAMETSSAATEPVPSVASIIWTLAPSVGSVVSATGGRIVRLLTLLFTLLEEGLASLLKVVLPRAIAVGGTLPSTVLIGYALLIVHVLNYVLNGVL